MAVSLYSAMVQNMRTITRGISEILTFKDHDTEVVRSFQYLGTARNNNNNYKR